MPKRKAVGETNSNGVVIGAQKGLGVEERADIFAREIVQNKKNQSDAFRVVFPHCLKWKVETVHCRSSKFAKTDRVKARIEYYRSRIVDIFDYEMAEILKGLHNIAFNDPAEMYDEKGNIKDIHDIPLHIRQTLTGIKHGVQMRKVCENDGVEISEPFLFIDEYRQESRKSALDKLLEYKVGVSRDPLPSLNDGEEIEVNKKQLARELLLLVYEANTEN